MKRYWLTFLIASLNLIFGIRNIFQNRSTFYFILGIIQIVIATILFLLAWLNRKLDLY